MKLFNNLNMRGNRILDCPDTEINDKKPTYEEAKELANIESGETVQVAFGKIAKAVKEIIAHFKDKVMHITADERNKWNRATQTSVSRNLTTGTKVGTITVDGKEYDLYCQTNTDTKNTAGSTDSNSKLFLIGAASQSANPQTYSHDTAYVGADGCLYSNNSKTVTVGDITQSPAVTSAGQKALDAREKNASIEGTLANEIGKINGNLTNINAKLCRMFSTSWGTSLKIPSPIPHGFILVNHAYVYAIWTAGNAGYFNSNIFTVCGDSNILTVSTNAQNGEVDISIPFSGGITYIGR